MIAHFADCVELFMRVYIAGAEAYLPLLEALDSLLQGPSQGTVIRTMKTLAPAWFTQIAPAEADGRGNQQTLQSVSQEQLKRQLAVLFREMSHTAPVILFLDDLQWADTSTIDMLSYLAAKFAELRLLVIVTYRSSDLRLTKHPFLSLKLDLEGRGICRDMEVGLLTCDEIGSYLAVEFPAHRFPTSFAQQLHSRTEGNPLFLVNLVSDLRDRQVIAQQDGQWVLRTSLDSVDLELPASIRSMIERKRQKLSEDDRQVLGAASVQGYEFDSALLAEALGLELAAVEERLAVLEHVHRFVRSAGETDFPDRSPSWHFRFSHVLYQNSFFNQLTPARRRTLSMAIAAALEHHHGSEAQRIASELAVLCEAAREFRQSSHYYLLAAKNAARLSAHQEAVQLARRGLGQLKSLPEDTERMRRELGLQNALAYSLFLIEGYGVPEVEQTFQRAQDLAQKTGQAQELFGILRGLCFYYGARGQLLVERRMTKQALELAEQSGDPSLRIVSYHLSGDHYLWTGDFTQSRDFLLKGIDLYHAERDRSLPERFGAYDLSVGCRMFLAHDLWYLGYPDQALNHINEAVRLARELNHPYSIAASLTHLAWIHTLRGEPAMAAQSAEEGFQLSSEAGFPFHVAHAKTFRGWTLCEQGSVEQGIREIQDGMEMYRRTGATVENPFKAILLADALAKTGRFDLGMVTLDNARTGIEKDAPIFCEAEIYRERGELLAAMGNVERGERCFHKALEIARRQNAKSLELRAAISLANLYREMGRTAEAHEILGDAYGWFSEGFDTSDLKNARTVLESLM